MWSAQIRVCNFPNEIKLPFYYLFTFCDIQLVWRLWFTINQTVKHVKQQRIFHRATQRWRIISILWSLTNSFWFELLHEKNLKIIVKNVKFIIPINIKLNYLWRRERERSLWDLSIYSTIKGIEKLSSVNINQ